MMGDFNVNDVEEILVRFATGDEIIYKEKGLEKLRRLMASSPAYGEAKGKQHQGITVVDDYSDSYEEDTPVKPKKTPSKKVKPKKGPSIAPNGYHTADLDYSASASKGKSAIDIARDMQRQAEQASGIKF